MSAVPTTTVVRVGRGARGGTGLARAGAGLLAVIVVLALAAPLLTSWGPTEIDARAIDAAPGASHLLGTDVNGMDLWSRVLHAARLDLFVAVCAVAIAVTVGAPIGAALGYVGGWIDELAMRVVDIVQSFPAFVLALAVAALVGPSTAKLIVVIALVNAPSYARLMRGEVRSTRAEGYVEAARCAGESELSVLLRHVVPNSLRPLFVIAPLNCGWAILMLAGLSFLGLGVPVPQAEWGAMISLGAADMVAGRWLPSVVPGTALLLTVLGFNLLAEGLLDARRRGDAR